MCYSEIERARTRGGRSVERLPNPVRFGVVGGACAAIQLLVLAGLV